MSAARGEGHRFSRYEIQVRVGKGDKGRMTMLTSLHQHLEHAMKTHVWA